MRCSANAAIAACKVAVGSIVTTFLVSKKLKERDSSSCLVGAAWLRKNPEKLKITQPPESRPSRYALSVVMWREIPQGSKSLLIKRH
jgi:hypothetical protein